MLDLRLNSGARFECRPIRPATVRSEGAQLPHQPASTEPRFRKHYKFRIPGCVVEVKDIPREAREALQSACWGASISP